MVVICDSRPSLGQLRRWICFHDLGEEPFLGDGSDAVFHWVGLRHLPQHKAGMLDRVVMETIFANLYNNKETL